VIKNNSAAYDIELLFEMLRYKRPHASHTENIFVEKYISSINGSWSDNFGNVYVQIGNSPTILWSCHTDTVHKTEGMQGILFHKDCYLVERDIRDGAREPLGADDAVGVWILINMINARIPGLYIFHRGEEKGGLGSDFIARHNNHVLEGITHAIAFDRAGQEDVITHQLFGRCCSDEFAYHIAHILNHRDYCLSPCDRGIFTDTANYSEFVAECTNVSVGYEHEHTPDECVDIYYLTNLMDAILAANFNDMPVVREPGPEEKDDYGAPFGNGKWNTVGGTSFQKGYNDHRNKANTWLTWDDLWYVHGAGGPQILIQTLLDLGVTEQDIDNAWETLGDVWDQKIEE